MGPQIWIKFIFIFCLVSCSPFFPAILTIFLELLYQTKHEIFSFSSQILTIYLYCRGFSFIVWDLFSSYQSLLIPKFAFFNVESRKTLWISYIFTYFYSLIAVRYWSVQEDNWRWIRYDWSVCLYRNVVSFGFSFYFSLYSTFPTRHISVSISVCLDLVFTINATIIYFITTFFILDLITIKLERLFAE